MSYPLHTQAAGKASNRRAAGKAFNRRVTAEAASRRGNVDINKLRAEMIVKEDRQVAAARASARPVYTATPVHTATPTPTQPVYTAPVVQPARPAPAATAAAATQPVRAAAPAAPTPAEVRVTLQQLHSATRNGRPTKLRLDAVTELNAQLNSKPNKTVSLQEYRGVKLVLNKYVSSQLEVAANRRSIDADIATIVALQHDHIAPVLATLAPPRNSAASSAAGYFVEHFAGGNLSVRLQRGAAGAASLRLKWARQIASAVNYMHTQQPPVIHRDLKCENVVLTDSDGDAKLIDMDLARYQTSVGGQSTTVAGTYKWMSPEATSARITVKSDVWSFGCMLIELFSEPYVVPWQELAQQRVYGMLMRMYDAMVENKETQSVPELANISVPWVKQLAARCLTADPATRPSMAEVVRVLADQGASARGGVVGVGSRSSAALLAQAAATQLTVEQETKKKNVSAAASSNRVPSTPRVVNQSPPSVSDVLGTLFGAFVVVTAVAAVASLVADNSDDEE